MRTTRHITHALAVLIAGGALLMVTAAASADPPGGSRGRDSGPSDRRGGFEQRSDHNDRGNDRGSWSHDRRDTPRYEPRYEPRYDHRDRHDDSRLGIRIQFGDRPTVQTVQRWVPGYFTFITEQVLIEPARTEARWVEPVTETRYPSNGPAYTVVLQPGGWQTITIPARYETRTRQVWVEGHYECVPVVTTNPSPRISIGGVIVF